MKTPSHFALGWSCARILKLGPRDTRIFIAGAILPDLPVVVGWTLVASHTSLSHGRLDSGLIRVAMDKLYFSDSLLACLHNLFHAPLSLFLMACIGWVLMASHPALRRLFLVLIAGAACHSVLDILTHVHDGPLLLWPLERSMRFTGPVSHWDPLHGGTWFTMLEILGGMVFGGFWLIRRFFFGESDDENRAAVSRPI